MASGDTLFVFTARDGIPTATVGAAHTIVAGTSTPAEGVPALAFDDTTDEYVDFFGIMPRHYANGGVTLTLVWAASEAATDVVEWKGSFRLVSDDDVDFDTTSFNYSTNQQTSGPVTAPSVVGEWAYDTIAFTNGTQMNGVGVGQAFILRINRDASPSSGTDVTGDAYLFGIEIKET